MEKQFIEIINTHQGLIGKICRMYTRSAADAEDLYQEIILQLWKSFPRFQQASSVSTWMYRVALNTAISGFRRQSRSLLQQELKPEVAGLPATDASRLEVQYGRQLQAAIQSLNKFDRSLMLLYLEEKTYQEMAEILGIAVSNVGVKINRIKKQLKNILNA
ncbi:RNA polymerase subunit sigma-70 [Chitinophaga parva]|uniref:RNA polymerase subunit sigma-70 n=1 Tax=Chitinophaga parva TaxID=2169414 RepID=A0A2T7BGC5_9BACT|nr:sigma-70 family RNA polymerase sigma factor [Chitinophaga parva]PUZ25342.1 RNA polymerase subunit sigma-70 [Chitinophaga parva]